MPFTNIWNQTFPPDTQAANQLGLDLRQFKLDFQQRRAAMSGIDSQRPAYAQDTQPASWNGTLFFAADTQTVYRFQNPAFVDVTRSFSTGLPRTFKNQSIVPFGGQTTLQTPYTITVPAGTMTATSRVRISAFAVTDPSGGNGTIALDINGNTFASFIISPVGASAPFWILSIGGNMGQTGNQNWNSLAIFSNATSSSGAIATTVNTAQTVTFHLTLQNPPAGITTFYGMLVEVM